MTTKAIFGGIIRKVVLIPLVMTAIGWLLVVIGFGISSQTFVDFVYYGLADTLDPDDVALAIAFTGESFTQRSYLNWIVCMVGPFIIIAAILHAALWKPLSPIVGAVTAFLNVLFLTGLGMMLYYYGEVIRHVREEDNDEDYDYDYYDYDYDYYDNDDDDYRLSVFNIPVEDYEGNDLEVPTYVSLQFAGAVIAIVSWTVVLVLWNFYDGLAAEQENIPNEPSSAPQTSFSFDALFKTASGNWKPPFGGIPRKLVLPFILLTGIGWLIVVIGFGIGSNEEEDLDEEEDDDDYSYYSYYYDYDDSRSSDSSDQLEFGKVGPNDRDNPLSSAFWIVCISGPLTFIAALLHAALWRPLSPFVGAVTTVLNVFFLTGLGMVVFVIGLRITVINKINIAREEYEVDIYDIPGWYAAEFAGAVIAIFFWTPVTILWHFYDSDAFTQCAGFVAGRIRARSQSPPQQQPQPVQYTPQPDPPQPDPPQPDPPQPDPPQSVQPQHYKPSKYQPQQLQLEQQPQQFQLEQQPQQFQLEQQPQQFQLEQQPQQFQLEQQPQPFTEQPKE